MRIGNLASLAVGAGGVVLYRNAKNVGKQNTPFRRYWEHNLLQVLDSLERADQRGEELPLIYVALGDSAAQGLGASKLEDGYVPRIAAGLEQATGRDVALLNISLSGGTVASVTGTQIPQLRGLNINGKPLSPDVVTLDIGGNDVGLSHVDLKFYERRYRQMCANLPAGTFIADVPSFKPLNLKQRAKDLSAVAAQVIPEFGHYHVRLEELAESLPTSDYIFKYHAGDLFHPNSAWYARWAQLFLDELARVKGTDEVDVQSLPTWRPSV